MNIKKILILTFICYIMYKSISSVREGMAQDNECECADRWNHHNTDTQENDARCGCGTTSDYTDNEGKEIPWCKCKGAQTNWKNCLKPDFEAQEDEENCDCISMCVKTNNHKNGTVPWCYTKTCCKGSDWKECPEEFELETDARDAETAARDAETAADQAEQNTTITLEDATTAIALVDAQLEETNREIKQAAEELVELNNELA